MKLQICLLLAAVSLSTSAQQLDVKNLVSSNQQGVIMALGQDSLGPGISLTRPTLNPDSLWSIHLGSTLREPRLKLSNLASGSSGIDIELTSLSLESKGPALLLRMDDPLDDLFGGWQEFRLIDTMPRLRISNLIDSTVRGIDIELISLQLEAHSPAIHLYNNSAIPHSGYLELVPSDTLPRLTIHNPTPRSTALSWSRLSDTAWAPSIILDIPILLQDTIPMIRLQPSITAPQLFIASPGLSNDDRVSIGLLPPLDPLIPFPGPTLDLVRPSQLNETLQVFIFHPIDTTPFLKLGNTGLHGQGGIVLDTKKDLLLRSVDSTGNASLRLDDNGSVRMFAEKGYLFVSNLQQGEGDGVRLELGNSARDTALQIEYDSKNRSLKFINPVEYIDETEEGLSTTYTYDGLDRRIIKVLHDNNNPGNDLLSEYNLNTKSRRHSGADTVTNSNSLGLESKSIYHGVGSISEEFIAPLDIDTFRRSYRFGNNSLSYTSIDSFTIGNSGSLCIGHRFFEPGKSVSVDVLNKFNNTRMTTLYNLNSRSIHQSGIQTCGITSPGNMFHSSSCDDGSRTFARTYTDSTSGESMRCFYEPNTHSLRCVDVETYSYSTSTLSCRSQLTGSIYTTSVTDSLSSETMTRTFRPSQRQLVYQNTDVRVIESSLSNNVKTRHIFEPARYQQQHLSGPDTISVLFDIPNRAISLSDPQGNPVNLTTTGQINVSSVSSGDGSFNGTLETQDVNVFGTLNVFGVKNFKIDHPLDPTNKYLIHSCVESPDMMNVYNGNITTDSIGIATVILPDYFEALNRDFRYQLTVIGQFAQAIVLEKVKLNTFKIQTDQPCVEVSWQVTGVRHDPAALAAWQGVVVDKELADRDVDLQNPNNL